MRIISYENVVEEVKKAIFKISFSQDPKVCELLNKAYKNERGSVATSVLFDILENARIAEAENLPLCQDTGMVVAFVGIGRVELDKGNIEDAINEGVKQAYDEFYLRKSIVADPFQRKNTNTNTPAIIHYELRDDEKLCIEIASKGIGSENQSALKMLTPADGVEGVIDFVLETVKAGGGAPCPPLIVGVGIGGSMEKAALMAKKSLFRETGKPSRLSHIREIEEILLTKINQTGIGPMGLGGYTTALAVHIEVFPTHIGGLPVAVNLNCHSSRHAKIEL